jgi:hypothetical protein
LEQWQTVSYILGQIVKPIADSVVANVAALKIMGEKKDSSIRNEIINVVATALQKTCVEMEWEYDEVAIQETEIELNLSKIFSYESFVVSVLETLTGLEHGDAEKGKTVFRTNLLEQIAKNQMLVNHLALRQILDSTKQIFETERSYDEWIALVEAQCERCRNSTLFPWSQKSVSYRKAFPKLFVHPEFESSKTGEIFVYEKLQNHRYRNLLFLGVAGAGKTTLLKQIFAFSKNFSNSGEVNGMVLYLDARDLLCSNQNKLSVYFTEITKGRFNPPHHTLFLVDCIDEAFFGKTTAFGELVHSLRHVMNCAFWFGCRSDYFSSIYTPMFEDLFFEKLIICPWSASQADKFICNYEQLENCQHIKINIEKMINKNSEIENFKHNPFHLSILIFLCQYSDRRNKDIINGLYDLYDKFMKVWIGHERNRGTSIFETLEIYEVLYSAAGKIYQGETFEMTKEITDSAIRGLLIIEKNELTQAEYAIGFYHRSLSAYFLATKIIGAIKQNGLLLLTIFSQMMMNDVTDFVHDGLKMCNPSEKQKMYNNLKMAYYACANYRIDDKVKNRESVLDTLSDKERFVVQDQAIYYITRLEIDVADFILKEFYETNNPHLRMNIAYGALSVGPKENLSEVILEYARALSPGTNEDIINRSWTMVYFNDVDAEPYSYRDTENRPWSNARNQRLKRFKNPKKDKDRRFYLFDLPLFYCFLENRNWSDLNPAELSVLENVCLDKRCYTVEEYDFLVGAKDVLIKSYKEHLFCE